jgi:hypothetical protein
VDTITDDCGIGKDLEGSDCIINKVKSLLCAQSDCKKEA